MVEVTKKGKISCCKLQFSLSKGLSQSMLNHFRKLEKFESDSEPKSHPKRNLKPETEAQAESEYESMFDLHLNETI